MKSVFKGLIMTFGMFSAIPTPKTWDDSGAKQMMPFLPLVGLVVGMLWWLAADILDYFGYRIGGILAAGILMLVPLLLVGFIHLDGFMDTSDAILSRRSFEEKLRILKDPHPGAFAIIMLAILFILQYAAVFQSFTKGWPSYVPLFVIPIVSRSCSAMSVLCLKPMTLDGYFNLFKPDSAAPHRVFTVLAAICAFALAWLFTGALGLIVAGVVVLGYVVAMLCAMKSFEFKGVSGDLAGFALVISELCGLVALAVINM